MSWDTKEATVSDWKFTMPTEDMAFNGSWSTNENTACKIEYYLESLGRKDYIADGIMVLKIGKKDM